jgi:hypothetical protein
VQRIGYGSFEPDQGVLIAKNKAWPAGATRGTEGSSCGYNCFTWVVDAHPEDMNTVDYYKPDGTPIMRTVADYRQLNDALFHAGTNSGSSYELVDGPNHLHFYVVDKYTDARGILHYILGIQNPDGAGPQTRGVAIASEPGDALNTCTFKVTNTGVAAPTDPALHPQDERASLESDIYRLSASASGQGWKAELRNALATAKFGESVDVPVYVSRTAESAASNTVTLTATSVSDPSKTATASCAQAQAGGPSRNTCTPARTPGGSGSALTARAITSATARPDCASPLRLTRSTDEFGTKPKPTLLRSVCSAPIEAPYCAGTCQRLCGPPGPLNDPRSIMSQVPEPTRRYGVTYGLLLLWPTEKMLWLISWVIVPELSPWRMLDSPHCCLPANQDVQST